MPLIKFITTLEDVKADKPETIWYSFVSCWWTHRQSDLRTLPDNGMPCGPRGGVLMMGPADEFLAAAEANPRAYGKYGLKAFMAAHNDNCVVSESDDRNTCLRTWPEYNGLIERDCPDEADLD